MDTLIVELHLPAINQSNDYVLPAHIPVGILLPALTEAVRLNTGVEPVDAQHPLLCFVDGQTPIPPEKTLSQAGVRDSAQLMLI